jgi:hypothetical protein
MENLGPEYQRPTRRSGYRYQFYIKHHSKANSNYAQWLETLSQDEEFAVFESADEHEIANPRGDLFGLHLGAGGEILVLGTRDEQVAEFPFARPGQAWHGYPMWPLKRSEEASRGTYPVPREALNRMVDVGLLTRSQKSRLSRGKHV